MGLIQGFQIIHEKYYYVHISSVIIIRKYIIKNVHFDAISLLIYPRVKTGPDGVDIRGL